MSIIVKWVTVQNRIKNENRERDGVTCMIIFPDSMPNWERLYNESKKGVDAKYRIFFQRKQASSQAKNFFGWIEWIVITDQPFRFVENKFTKKKTTLQPVGRATVARIVTKLAAKVRSRIATLLPHQFGGIFDGIFESFFHVFFVFLN